MSGSRTQAEQLTYQCPECGNKFPVWKQMTSRNRERSQPGHIKDLYCYRCEKVTKHEQLSNYIPMFKEVNMDSLKVQRVGVGIFAVDSRDVAEMVGKEHYNLLRDIQGYEHILLNSNLSSVDFFIKSTYQDSTGRTLPCYLITRKGCDMVANKMTGEKGVLFTAAYVTKFEEMEKALMPKYQLPKTFAEALRLAADLEEEKQKLLPKAESFDSLMSADGLYAIADAAKILNYEAIGPKKIFEVLQAEGFLFKRGRWHAKQCYIDWGYFTEKTHPLNFGSANSEVYTQVFVTPKGLDMLDKHFARNGFKKNPKVVNQ